MENNLKRNNITDQRIQGKNQPTQLGTLFIAAGIFSLGQAQPLSQVYTANNLIVYIYLSTRMPGEIKFSLFFFLLLEFFLLRIGTATEPSSHCKQSNRVYLFVYAEAGRNKIRNPTEKQNSSRTFRIGEKLRQRIADINIAFFSSCEFGKQ